MVERPNAIPLAGVGLGPGAFRRASFCLTSYVERSITYADATQNEMLATVVAFVVMLPVLALEAAGGVACGRVRAEYGSEVSA